MLSTIEMWYAKQKAGFVNKLQYKNRGFEILYHLLQYK